MRVTVALLSLLLLSVVVGCEGNEPRRSPLAATSSPSAAKPVEYAPPSKVPVPGQRIPGQPNPNPQPGVEAPANNGPITINRDKLETRKQELNYHTAIFLKSEVGSLTTTGINENNNFVFRPAEGLNKLQIGPLVYGYKADIGKGKPPAKPQDLVKLVGDFLTPLEENQFYVYDPALVTEENKEEMLYLQQYP